MLPCALLTAVIVAIMAMVAAEATTRQWGVPETLVVGGTESCCAADDRRDSSSDDVGVVTTPLRVVRIWLRDDGTFPNNEFAPLLVFFNATSDPRCPEAEGGAELLVRNGWTSPWAWGVFTYHHYHSTAWEALLCVQGSASIQFGGPSGPALGVAVGDLILIPPGVAHKQLESKDFTLLGAYPIETPSADTCRGKPTAAQKANIEGCPVPAIDPVFGKAQMPWGEHFSQLFEADVYVAAADGSSGCSICDV
jgi:uncharacterized protein YjlB